MGKEIKAKAKSGLENLKYETASELGLSNYQNMDKGELTARQNGYVGGYMTKKLVEMAENQLAGR
ncbi:MAG: alpha/beta-type small acid-soluble spore protein [Firmicutes bacterium]|nr:alpha/beta-type small acid-soluble spore protein [Bacillota bacterium]